MLVDIEVRNGNPIYLGLMIADAKKGRKTISNLLAPDNQMSADTIGKNVVEFLQKTPPDSRPVRIKGSAPSWVVGIVVATVMVQMPGTTIELKRGKNVIKLPVVKTA